MPFSSSVGVKAGIGYRAYSISQTETGSDQTLRIGFDMIYCIKQDGEVQ